MSMIDIIVCGAAGRMGHAIIAAASEDPDVNIIGLVEAAGHAALQQPVRIGGTEMKIRDQLPRTGKAVVIEFTVPAATAEHLREAVISRYPMVIGTTGLTDMQMQEVTHAARKIAIVQAANMSTGVNVLMQLVREAVRALGEDADIEIIETHHNKKKDAPSGTALAIADAVAETRGRVHAGVQNLAHGRRGNQAARKPGEVGIHAVRGGDIAGDHTVLFALAGERLELTHRAHGREALARGALRAAKFSASAPHGLYTMNDVLGLPSSPS